MILLLMFACAARAVEPPGWFPKAPALPAPQGKIVRVASSDELLAAAEHAEPDTTILIENGEYKMPRPIVLQDRRNLVLRSAAGDPRKVTLAGKGWSVDSKNDDILHIGRCDGITIAALTFADCRSYGIKVEAENGPKNVHIVGCRFRDIGVRAIKGSAGSDPEIRARKGSVRFCHFENTKVPPADWLFSGDYIAAIDMMALDEWTFSDNFFHNIKGRNGGGRAAIFIWVRSRQVKVERNLIVDCDRGIAFGNPGQSTANNPGETLSYVSDSIVQNNMISGGADCGIELWHAQGIQLLHNTIWRPERNWNRGIRIGAGTARAKIINNLVHGKIQEEGGEAELSHNFAGRLDSYFTDAASGNLALTPTAREAIGRGRALPEVAADIRGKSRREQPDLGAWEWGE